MPRLACLLLAALVLSPHAWAQDADTPLEEGARALMFQVGPDLTLGSFSGSTLSMKWHRSEAAARRLGLTVSTDVSFGDQGASQNQNGDEQTQSRRTNQQSGLVSVNLVGLTYRRSRTPVYFYHGVGPTATVAYSRAEQDVAESGGRDPYGDLSSRLYTSAGVLGVVGVEWVVASAVSLTGEYSTSLQASYERSTTSHRSPDGAHRSDRFGARLASGSARLGVSVYF